MIIRKVPSNASEYFLTFDDGPDENMTPRILDLLEETRAKATFFVIGKKAEQQESLIRGILKQGSQVISHSIDHDFRRYFHHTSKMKNWINESVDHLAQITGQRVKGFRPPAGILTPPLLQASKELEIPLILWNHRFYDSVWLWSEKKAGKSLRRLSGGDIVLLHDVQSESHKETFLRTLRHYLSEARNKGFQSSALPSQF